MRTARQLRFLFLTLLVAAVLSTGSAQAQTYTYSVLYSFAGSPDGTFPTGGVPDAQGNLYGTTGYGGAYAQGTVFKLAPNPDGSWSETVLYNFTGAGGAYPFAGLVLDARGNLYGTTQYGGAYGGSFGTVFELTPRGDGTYSETVLYTFKGGTDASNPQSGLVRDAQGNLYGTTPDGGAYGQGTVFKLTPNQDGSWSEAVLHSFTGGLDGGNPTAVLVLDAQGNLYGNTRNGGADGSGTVFKLTPNQDGSWSETVLYSFTGGADGESPRGSLLRDAPGNLYGHTKSGGNYGYGTLFKLDTTDQETVLYSFTGGTDGNWPGNFVRDAQGNLYGTTQYGGAYGEGTVFKLTPNPDGTWSETVLHSFTGTGGDGVTPDGLVQDAFGNLYGTTGGGGAYGQGTVFELQLPPTLTVSIIGTGTVTSTDGFIHCPGT